MARNTTSKLGRVGSAGLRMRTHLSKTPCKSIELFLDTVMEQPFGEQVYILLPVAVVDRYVAAAWLEGMASKLAKVVVFHLKGMGKCAFHIPFKIQ